MSNPRVALVISEDHPSFNQDNGALVEALAKLNVEASVHVWTDKSVDWAGFDLVVLRSTWDYGSRREEFLEWAKSVPKLENPASALVWNTDKEYLKTMAEKGIPTIRTVWLDPARHFSSQAIHTRLPAFGDFVIKPTISAGSQGVARYQEATATARTRAINQVRDMLAAGNHVMIQPYLTSVDHEGETSVVFFNGEYSHSFLKSAMLSRGTAPSEIYVEESLKDGVADETFLDLARKSLSAAREILGIEDELLYARVDMLPGEEGLPVLLEIELVEPRLFVRRHPGAVENYARAIAARLSA
ncbi:hypothetical protein [Timonella senegalensis]|uniref:ATP-grasp domain-containing protein n=1 Tax=Timonella senegalensis TaxID=1465825 RepID=UPI002FE2A36C